MSTLSVHRQKSEAVERATVAWRYLEAHPRTTLKQLGSARDVLAAIHMTTDPAAIRDYLEGIEAVVVEVYGGHPATSGRGETR